MAFTFSSPKKGWTRAMFKHSPSKTTQLSPVNPIYAHMACPGFTMQNDPLLEGFVLATMLSEENHYINTIGVIREFKHNPSDLNKVLHGMHTNTAWFDRITDVKSISQGSFGKVFQAYDKPTKQFIAIKNIVPTSESHYKHFLSQWKIFMERNILVSTNASPFITKLIGTFQDESLSSFWIFMEYCPFTLIDLVKHIGGHVPEYVAANLFREGSNVIDTISRRVEKKVGTQYTTILIAYYYETLCGLDFLADRHIVHCDLKPDNLLIGTNGHIRVADVGAALRFRWVDKRSALHLMNKYDNLEKKVDELDMEFKRSGNTYFLDPETYMRYLQTTNPTEFIKLTMAYPRLEPLKNNEELSRQTFVTDLFAATLLFVQLLMGDILLIQTINFDSSEISQYNLENSEVRNFNMPLCYNADIFDRFIQQHVKRGLAGKHACVADLMCECLKPREERALDYLRDIQVMRNDKVAVEKAIDIKKVTHLSYFKKRNINKSTVMNMKILITEVQELRDQMECGRVNIDISKITIDKSTLAFPSANYTFVAP